MRALLGIDAGTSTLKVAAFSRQGKVLGTASRPVQVINSRPGWAEIDAETYWNNMVEAIREVVIKVDDVVSIGIAATSPTTIALDADFNALSFGILYLDHRSDGLITEKIHSPDIEYFTRVGNRACCSTCWLANTAWLAKNRPDIWKRTRYISLLGGFLAARMIHRPVIDWTQASYSGGFRPGYPEAGWDKELLDFWEVDAALLPDVDWSCRPAGELLPEAADAMGMTPGITVAFGAADTAASAFALNFRESGDVFESAGTSGVITFCLAEPKFENTFMNRCHVFPSRWLAHGAMSTLGGAFDWINSKVFPDVGGIKDIECLAGESAAGANGVLFLPYLAGERSPVWDAAASGAWVGLRIDNTRADMARAVFEGTAFGLRQILDRGRSFWGFKPSRLLAVGGGSESRLWAEIKSDILGLEYVRASEPATAVMGAALIGGVAAGEYSGVDDPDIPFARVHQNKGSSRRLDNDTDVRRAERRHRYEEMYSIYERIYPSLSPLMRDLAGMLIRNQ
jgi:xylulokinase